MNKKLVAGVMAVSIMGLSTVAFAAEGEEKGDFGVELRYFSPKLSGGVQSNSMGKVDFGSGGGYSVSRIDLKDDLHHGNKVPTEFLLRYKNVTLDYMNVKTSGNVDSAGVTVNDVLYGTDANTSLKFQYLKLDVDNPITKTNSTEFTWQYGINLMSMDVQANGLGVDVRNGMWANYSAGEKATVVFPSVGVKVKQDLGNNFDVYAGIYGLPLGSYGHFYDLEAGLAYSPVKNVTVKAGYRDINLDLHRNDDRAKYRLDGFFLGAEYSF